MAYNNSDIKKTYTDSYNEAYSSYGSFYDLANTDLRYFLGDQWSKAELRRLEEEGRSAFVFNRIRRNINLITGYQIKNRLSSIVNPIEASDQKTADQYTKLMLYAFQLGNGFNTISDAFGGACKTGWNLINVWMDYVDDPKDGKICFGRDPFSSFITDPYFTKLDLSDCGYVIKRKYLSKDQASALLPEHEKAIADLQKKGSGLDDKFTWMPYQHCSNGSDLVSYDEFYQQKFEKVPFLIDKETGEFTEWDGRRDRLTFIKNTYPQIEIVYKPKKYIEKHILINGEYVSTDRNEYGMNEYPFAPVAAIFESECDDYDLRLQSLVRCQIDPQRESNRRRSQMTDMIDSQINSGWIADDNSVVNPRSLFQTSQGRVIWRKRDAKPGSLEKIPPAQIPPSMFQLQELFDRDMVEILGLNDSTFGMPESGNESGLMMMLRQSSAIINIQNVFDNLRLAQKLVSQKVIKLIRTWSPEKIKRILNEDPTEAFFNANLSQFDISVSEGMLTENQKMIYYRQLLDLKQVTDVPSQGPITAQMLIDAAPLQGKSDLTEQIAKNEEAAKQSQQQQEQVNQEMIRSQIDMAKAKAISDLALSKERLTRATANMGLEDERASKAVTDRSDAALNRIKAIKEIQTMDDERLLKYMTIVKMMEEGSQREEEQIKMDNLAFSERAAQQNQQSLQQPQQMPMQQEMMQQPQQGIGQ